MSFVQGLSGLGAASKQLDVIGNNVANANTVGFKGSIAEFGDVFATALSGAGSSAQTGTGAQLLQVAQQFSKGNITSTNSALDVAISGAGFFVLNNQQGTYYSRNGQFELDKNGYIVNSAGDKLQGYAIYPKSGLPSGSPTNLTIPTSVSSAAATGQGIGAGAKGIVAGLNFNSTSLPPIYAFDPTNPTTFNKSETTTTYDSKGVAQTTTMYFVKASATDVTTNTVPSVDGGSIVTANGVTTVTLPNTGVDNLAVGAVVQGGSFPAGTTVASVVGGATPQTVPPTPYTGFTTSAAPAAVPVPGTLYPLTIDVPNNWNIYTTVQDPTTGAYLYPTPAYNAAVVAALAAAGSTSTNPWVPNGTLTFGTSGTTPTFTNNTSALATTLTALTDAVTGVTNGISGPDTGNTNFPGAPDITFQPAGANLESFKIDYSSSTQFGVPFGTNTLTQDGYTAGQLSGFTIGTDGIIQGTYSNNQTKALGQIALATFPNNQGLQPIGGNEWAQTGASGAPVVNAPGSGNNGILHTSATEASNVDLTAELVNMMTAQRTYQANAQTIKTADSVMQTLLNMR